MNLPRSGVGVALMLLVPLLLGAALLYQHDKASELEARLAKLEYGDRDEAWWWCPISGGMCTPQYRRPSKDGKIDALRASELAAFLCDEHDPTHGGCVETRLVICATQDPKNNLCMLTRAACEKYIAEANAVKSAPRQCVAYFDGRRATF